MRISDWSSDVCSSDLGVHHFGQRPGRHAGDEFAGGLDIGQAVLPSGAAEGDDRRLVVEGVEVVVRRKIAAAPPVAGGYPADRRRPNTALEGVVLREIGREQV